MHVCAESCRVSRVQRSEVKVHVCHVWHFLHGGTKSSWGNIFSIFNSFRWQKSWSRIITCSPGRLYKLKRRNEPLSYGTRRIEYFWSFTLKRKSVSACSSSSVTIFIWILCRWKYHSDQIAELEHLWVLICSGRVNECQKMYLIVLKRGAHKTSGSPESRFQKSSLSDSNEV